MADWLVRKIRKSFTEIVAIPASSATDQVLKNVGSQSDTTVHAQSVNELLSASDHMVVSVCGQEGERGICFCFSLPRPSRNRRAVSVQALHLISMLENIVAQ